MCFLSILPLAGLLTIVLLIFFKVVSLKSEGITVSAGSSKKPASRMLLYPLFLMLLLIWIWALVIQTFNIVQTLLPSFLIRKTVESMTVEITGSIFIILSLVLMLVTLVHFKSSLRFGMNWNNQGKLITTGIFSYSRNPFFLSIILYFIGQALIFPGIIFIAMALMAVAAIHFFILKEEKFMQLHYQNQYRDYMQKVRRYI